MCEDTHFFRLSPCKLPLNYEISLIFQIRPYSYISPTISSETILPNAFPPEIATPHKNLTPQTEINTFNLQFIKPPGFEESSVGSRHQLFHPITSMAACQSS